MVLPVLNNRISNSALNHTGCDPAATEEPAAWPSCAANRMSFRRPPYFMGTPSYRARSQGYALSTLPVSTRGGDARDGQETMRHGAAVRRSGPGTPRVEAWFFNLAVLSGEPARRQRSGR